jgi:hypothetical protein
VLGFPIRTPSDHSSVDNSPRTIAVSHVLHRLLMPRHPPCALNYLTTNTTQNKMLASTMQHSTHHHTPTHPQPPPHPTTHQQQVTDALDSPSQEQPEKNTPPTDVSSGPNSVPNPSPKTESFPGKSLCVPPRPHQHTPEKVNQQSFMRKGASPTQEPKPSFRRCHLPTREGSLERR